MKTVKRTERGWIGHYICADRCRFRRNTLLECGNRRVIVSTVGAQHDRKTGQFEEIGHGRYYETFVFRARRVFGLYWDVAGGEQLSSQLPWYIDAIPPRPPCSSAYGTESDLRANEMHEAIVEEFTQQLASGAKL